ncbi:MAG: RraA family protein [Microbacterium sp.]
MDAADKTPTADELSELLEIGASTVYEGSGQQWWVDPRIRPAWRGARLAGPAFTVKAATGDNLALQRAVREAPAGAVLVVDAGGGEFGHWGGILTEIALLRGLRGLVIDGTVRDIDEIEKLGFPIFSTGIAMRHANKSDPGVIGEQISLAGRTVRTGDVVVADADGVAIVPSDSAASALESARARAERERLRIATIRGGDVPAMMNDATVPA